MTDLSLQSAKKLVRTFNQSFDAAEDSALTELLAAWTSSDYSWRGVHPFHEKEGVDEVIDSFWSPLRHSFSSLQRREDIFFGGKNVIGKEESVWVVGMGHLVGLFDNDWLEIPATRKMTFLRYAEFHRIEDEKIAESAFFCDVLGIMHQADCFPLQLPTGAAITQPGPRTHDGILIDPQDSGESRQTMNLVNRMIDDLTELNMSGNDLCPPEVLQRTWHDDMVWYGPAGIGASYTIPRYQEQHQHPFRTQLKNKVFNGHVARVAEGSYAGFFGWPNLTNTPTGGFLGLPGSEVRADMRVVDIYRRDGDKLAENWVFIDLLHWLSMQGIDVLASIGNSQDG